MVLTRTLNFTVEGQLLKKDGDFSRIIRGSKQFLKCQFSFKNNDWRMHKIAATFIKGNDEYAVPVTCDGTCVIPDENGKPTNWTYKTLT